MTASVLETTGILAHVVGPSLAAHTGDILPLILDALQDAGEGRKRDVAVLTLAQVRKPGCEMLGDSARCHLCSKLGARSCCSILHALQDAGEGRKHNAAVLPWLRYGLVNDQGQRLDRLTVEDLVSVCGLGSVIQKHVSLQAYCSSMRQTGA